MSAAKREACLVASVLSAELRGSPAPQRRWRLGRWVCLGWRNVPKSEKMPPEDPSALKSLALLLVVWRGLELIWLQLQKGSGVQASPNHQSKPGTTQGLIRWFGLVLDLNGSEGKMGNPPFWGELSWFSASLQLAFIGRNRRPS